MFSGDISLIIGLTTISTKFAVLTIVSSNFFLVNLRLLKKIGHSYFTNGNIK